MVQNRPQMVRDFPSENSETRRNLPSGVLQKFMRGLFLVLTQKSFRRLQERLDLRIEATDALVGPF